MNAITIWKYPLRVEAEQVIQMPKNSQILHLDKQSNQMFLWVGIDINYKKELVSRTFNVVGTGQESYHSNPRNYIGTVVFPVFVWHVFEVL